MPRWDLCKSSILAASYSNWNILPAWSHALRWHLDGSCTTCHCPCGLTFTWWGCRGLCLQHVFDINPPSVPTPFHSVLVSVFVFMRMALSCKCNSSLSHSVLVLFLPYCPFNYKHMSLCESLPQPWYNPLWLTGLKAPTNYYIVHVTILLLVSVS